MYKPDYEARRTARLDFFLGASEPPDCKYPEVSSTKPLSYKLMPKFPIIESSTTPENLVQVIGEDESPNLIPKSAATKVRNTHMDHHPKTSNFQTLMNFVKASVGTGVLSLPFAFMHAGLLVGTFGSIVIGYISTYCMHELLLAYGVVSRGCPMDYADVVEQVFFQSKLNFLNKISKKARYAANSCLLFTQIGLCAVYMVFCEKMTKEVFEHYFPQFRGVGDLPYTAAITIVLIPYCFVKTLKVLSFFALVSNITQFICLSLILGYVLMNLQSFDKMPLTSDLGSFFVFFGSIMFAYESIALVLPIENKMKDRRAFGKWNGLLTLGMTFVISLYAAVGFYGYLAFGEDSRLVLRNLPDHWVTHSMKLAWSLCVFTSINLQLYVAVQIIWPTLKATVNKSGFDNIGEYLLRSAIILFCFLLAVSVPCLEQLIALVGSLAMSSLGLCIPAILDLVVHLPRKTLEPEVILVETAEERKEIRDIFLDQQSIRKSVKKVTPLKMTWIVIRCVFIFTLGISSCIVGSFMTIREIARLLSSPEGCP